MVLYGLPVCWLAPGLWASTLTSGSTCTGLIDCLRSPCTACAAVLACLPDVVAQAWLPSRPGGLQSVFPTQNASYIVLCPIVAYSFPALCTKNRKKQPGTGPQYRKKIKKRKRGEPKKKEFNASASRFWPASFRTRAYAGITMKVGMTISASGWLACYAALLLFDGVVNMWVRGADDLSLPANGPLYIFSRSLSWLVLFGGCWFFVVCFVFVSYWTACVSPHP